MGHSTPEFRALMTFLRNREEISARALSEKAGLSLSYVSKMENGSVTPTVEVWSKIVKHLNVGNEELVYLVRTLGDLEGNKD